MTTTADPAATVTAHRVTVTVDASMTLQFGAYRMQATCPCGWAGPATGDVWQVNADRTAHLEQVELGGVARPASTRWIRADDVQAGDYVDKYRHGLVTDSRPGQDDDEWVLVCGEEEWTYRPETAVPVLPPVEQQPRVEIVPAQLLRPGVVVLDQVAGLRVVGVRREGVLVRVRLHTGGSLVMHPLTPVAVMAETLPVEYWMAAADRLRAEMTGLAESWTARSRTLVRSVGSPVADAERRLLASEASACARQVRNALGRMAR